MAKKIGTCRCTFGGLRQDFATGDIEMILKVHKDSKAKSKKIAESAKDIDLTLSLEKYTEKRSLDANAYFWALAGKLAAVLNISMEDIYRQYVRNIGDNFEIIPVRDDAKERWIKNWSSKGIGWICEDLGSSKLLGYSNIICYFGSSTYDTHQMHCLTQLIVQDCKDQSIETKTPHELELLMNEWAEKQTG